MKHLAATRPIERPRTNTKPRSGRAQALAVVAAVMLAGCAGIEPRDSTPLTAPTQPPPRAPAASAKLPPEHARMIALFDGTYEFAPAETYLNDILAKLAEAGGQGGEPYKVTILNSPVVNAFALPPANLYVTRGLLALANDASEVAAVMAHEIAHITARHALQREEEEKRAEVISQAAGVIQGKQKSDQFAAQAQRTMASFSRNQELEADEIGIRVAAKAGYDPFGASRFLISLGRSAALRSALFGPYSNAGRPDILATHPSAPERVAQAVRAARQIAAPGIGKTGRESYLAAIDGMTFGDDPAEGATRGQKYLHGRLGFAFVAPDGFSLENASQALLGIKSGGTEAMRLDSVSVPSATPLASYIASGWIDGLDPPSVATLEINGMPAAVATASAGEWQFRVAAIRFGQERVYRLIFAAHALTRDAMQRFQASIESFHHVSPEEVGAAAPFRIAIAAVKPGGTAEALAARMAAQNHPLETFLLINGLDRGEPLRRSEHYKIVVE